MNYSRAFSYVFEDKDWLSKILIAGLISLIPIIGQLYLFGWMIEIVRRVKAGRYDVLPTTHFTYFLTLGLKMFVVSLIYSIPVIILSCILNLIGSAGNSDSGNFVTAFLAGLGCLGGLLTLIVNIAVALLGTYGAIKLAETDQIKACLDFNDAFNCIKSNLSTFIIVELLAIVAGLIQSAGVILCLVGAIFTAPYGVAIIGNLVGQLWDNLKPYQKTARPVRGSAAKADDIIEEAPFTRVQDIEKDIEETVEEAEEFPEQAAETFSSVIEAAEASAQEEETPTEAEPADELEEVPAPMTEETGSEEAEEAAPEEETAEPESQDEKPADQNDEDLPHFE